MKQNEVKLGQKCWCLLLGYCSLYDVWQVFNKFYFSPVFWWLHLPTIQYPLRRLHSKWIECAGDAELGGVAGVLEMLWQPCKWMRAKLPKLLLLHSKKVFQGVPAVDQCWAPWTGFWRAWKTLIFHPFGYRIHMSQSHYTLLNLQLLTANDITSYWILTRRHPSAFTAHSGVNA